MKTLREVMTTPAQCLGSDTSLRDIAAKMKELDAGSIPICEKDRLVGMVTDRDIVIKTLGSGQDPDAVRAGDIMSSPIVYCYEDQALEDVARIMEVKQIRRLVVLNREKRLVGIVSLGDISLKGGSNAVSEEILEQVSKPIHEVA